LAIVSVGGQHRGAMKVPPLVFSIMQRSDLAAVLEVERQSFVHPWSAELFLQELRLPYSRIRLARVASDPVAVVGYVCRWITSGEMHILNVAVHPRWRRRAVGHRLIEDILDEARRSSLERATLEVRRHNRPAIALYESFGFEEVGTRRNYYGPGEDARLMELRFGEPGR
jgi:[ribosomal protein S18]-alanine N-acetyltransferase